MKKNPFCIVISGADIGGRGSIQHEDDFRFTRDGVLMNRRSMKQYYANGRVFKNPERLIRKNQAAPRRQIYFVGLYLYSLLTRNGYDVALVNCFEPGGAELEELMKQGPLAVIVSTTFTGVPEVEAIAEYVRARDPDVPLIVGGRWAWFSWRVLQAQDRAAYQAPDVRRRYFFTREKPIPGVSAYVVAEAGERTLLDVLDALRQGRASWTDLPNLALAESGAFRFTPQAPEDISIENLTIDWSRIPAEMTSTVLPMAFSLGCPFRCNFCNFSSRGYQRKSWDLIRRELNQLRDTQRFVQSLWFIDDNILTTPRHAVEFCNILEQEDYPFTWRSFIRADAITGETIGLLARSKCELVILGLESMDDRVLQAMGKKARSAQYRESVRLLADAGVSAELSFIIGFPEEDDASIARLSEFLSSLGPIAGSAVYFLYLFLFHLEPLAPIFEEELRARYNLSGLAREWRHATMTSDTAREKLREVYLAANSAHVFLNYLDFTPSGRTTHDLAIMAARERLAKSLLTGSAQSAALEQELERLVLLPA